MADEPTETGTQSVAQRFVEHMARTTARLVRVTSEGAFEGIASGFIVESQDRYFLISAGHALWSGEQWLLETNFSTTTETLLIELGPAQLISKIELSDLEKRLSEKASGGEFGIVKLPALIED